MFPSTLQPHDEWLYYHFHNTAIIISVEIVLDSVNLAAHLPTNLKHLQEVLRVSCEISLILNYVVNISTIYSVSTNYLLCSYTDFMDVFHLTPQFVNISLALHFYYFSLPTVTIICDFNRVA